MFGKRGLSDVVTTVLLILIALAVVAILWSFLQPSIKQDVSKITSACLTLDLTPESCVYVSNGEATATTYNATVRIKRGSDDVELKEIKAIFEQGAQSEVKSSKLIPDSLASESVLFSGLTNIPKETRVAGLIETEMGTEKLCPELPIKAVCIVG